MGVGRSSRRSIVELSYVDLDALLAAIGEHHVSAKTVAQRIGRSSAAATTRRSCRPRSSGLAVRRTGPDTVGVHVEGLDDVLVRLSRVLHAGAG